MPNDTTKRNGKMTGEHEMMLRIVARRMEDADAKRDAQRRMTWFASVWYESLPLVILVASVWV